ncbi:response regulator [Pirellulaceae bacterium SH501]
MRPFAESLGHSLSVDLGNGPMWVSGDESRLTQVFVVKLPGLICPSSDENGDLRADSNPSQEMALRPPVFRILVVDDDRAIRFLVSMLLRKMRQVVSVAESGERAMELVLRNRPDVVLLDLQLRGMDGYEVARQLRSMAEFEGIVLIALSGSSDAESLKRAVDSGIDQYLVKPVGLTELTNKLLHIARVSLRSSW